MIRTLPTKRNRSSADPAGDCDAGAGYAELVIEKLAGLREDFGIRHIVTRNPDDFAPIVAALAGR